MCGKAIVATVTALLLGSAGQASAKTHSARNYHSARHYDEPHRSRGAQGRYSREQSKCYDLGPGPTVVLPNFGPTSGEDVASLLGCRS